MNSENKRAILRARAEALAREPVKSDLEEDGVNLIVFALGGESYAIESNYIREVHTLKDLTPLPCVPPFVLGIFNLRGQILSAIDIRKFFGLPSSGITNLNKVAIAQDGDMEIGILADEIIGSRIISPRDVQPPLPASEGNQADYIKGITAERIIILDAAKILTDKKLIVHEEVEG